MTEVPVMAELIGDLWKLTLHPRLILGLLGLVLLVGVGLGWLERLDRQERRARGQ